MKTGGTKRVVLVTCGSTAEALKIARAVVRKRLAACANVFSAPVDSVYPWKGKVEEAREYLLIIKTTARRLKPLEKEVKRLHSYEVPEFVALPVAAGSREYLQWIEGNVKGRSAASRHRG